MNKNKDIKFVLFDTYIATIKKSVGAKMFQNAYALVSGKKVDVAGGGVDSCAVFASSVLVMFGLIKKRHATVSGTMKDMEKSGWIEIKKPKMGAILIWGPWEESSHWHIGFYTKNKKAISNDWKKRTPSQHHWTYGTKNGRPKRPIKSIWWHKSLDN